MILIFSPDLGSSEMCLQSPIKLTIRERVAQEKDKIEPVAAGQDKCGVGGGEEPSVGLGVGKSPGSKVGRLGTLHFSVTFYVA